MAVSIAIRGAGAAGLSAARAVVTAVPDARITIFDRRPRLPHPRRTFCFFDYPEAQRPVEPARRWAKVAFSGPSFERVIDCEQNPYAMIEGDRFYGQVVPELEGRGVRFHWNARWVETEANAVVTESGRHTADVVIDAAFSAGGRQAALWQSFFGLWVETAQPCFRPDVASLMSLVPADPGVSLSFVYLLPLSPTRALVEHTSYHGTPLSSHWHRKRLMQWLGERNVTVAREMGSEYGAIPLGLERGQGVEGVCRIGSEGGAIRPSTGYAFQALQRQAAKVARAIAAGQKPADDVGAAAYPAWMTAADGLFLRAMAQDPEHGLGLMERLLGTARAESLIPFLSGSAQPLEALRTMVCVPKARMIWSLCRPWPRRRAPLTAMAVKPAYGARR
jgi:lycopene beta-cyclase